MGRDQGQVDMREAVVDGTGQLAGARQGVEALDS